MSRVSTYSWPMMLSASAVIVVVVLVGNAWCGPLGRIRLDPDQRQGNKIDNFPQVNADVDLAQQNLVDSNAHQVVNGNVGIGGAPQVQNAAYNMNNNQAIPGDDHPRDVLLPPDSVIQGHLPNGQVNNQIPDIKNTPEVHNIQGPDRIPYRPKDNGQGPNQIPNGHIPDKGVHGQAPDPIPLVPKTGHNFNVPIQDKDVRMPVPDHNFNGPIPGQDVNVAPPGHDFNVHAPDINPHAPDQIPNPRMPQDQQAGVENNRGADNQLRFEAELQARQQPPGPQDAEQQIHVPDNGNEQDLKFERGKYGDRHNDAEDADDDEEEHKLEGGGGNDEDVLEDEEDYNVETVMRRKGHLRPNGPVKISDIGPPDHLDAVRMEQDGHLNRDYKKEIFLGEHEDFEKGTPEERKLRLQDIFMKVDTDGDTYISLPELEHWIVAKVHEHFKQADRENAAVFASLDTDRDGFITWREFHVQYLMAKGNTHALAQKQADDYDAIPLEPEDKEYLIKHKFRWAEADTLPQDNSLTLEEFKSFRHPESSPEMLNRMVEDILDNLDSDHDGIVTAEEFVQLPPGEVEGKWHEADRKWQDERRREFSKIIDLNHDGKLNRDELLAYVNPQNKNHALSEAKNLVLLADDNKDGKLSLKEVLNNMELFLGSKMCDTGRSFHDEF